jgi:hypothetical protein
MMTFNVLVGDMSCPNRANKRGCQNALITGKGEPALVPNTVKLVIDKLREEGNFERIEFQTSGYPWDFEFYRLAKFDLVSLSIYHFNNKFNQDIYDNTKLMPLEALISYLRGIGTEVRLSCNLLKGYISTPDKVGALIEFARKHDVMQLTLREIGTPTDIVATPEGLDAYEAVRSYKFDIRQIQRYLKDKGHLCYTMPHGAEVYEVDGQNVSLTTCLETEPNRYLIYFPQGWLTTSWEYVQGCRIL